MKWKENTLLKVPFAVGDKYKTALIDTGAELSLIRPSAVTYFGLQVEPLEFPLNIQCAVRRSGSTKWSARRCASESKSGRWI